MSTRNFWLTITGAFFGMIGAAVSTGTESLSPREDAGTYLLRILVGAAVGVALVRLLMWFET